MAEPASITPINKPKPKRGEPVLGLKKVDALPPATKPSSITDRIIDVVDEGNIADDSWYWVAAYPTQQGASNAVKWLRKNPRSVLYQFEARNAVVYVRKLV